MSFFAIATVLLSILVPSFSQREAGKLHIQSSLSRGRLEFVNIVFIVIRVPFSHGIETLKSTIRGLNESLS